MEALTAVSVAALTIYDMCKAVQKDIEITDVRLDQKRAAIGLDYDPERDLKCRSRPHYLVRASDKSRTLAYNGRIRL